MGIVTLLARLPDTLHLDDYPQTYFCYRFLCKWYHSTQKSKLYLLVYILRAVFGKNFEMQCLTSRRFPLLEILLPSLPNSPLPLLFSPLLSSSLLFSASLFP